MNKDIEILAKRKIADEDARLADEFRKELSDTKLELERRGLTDSGAAVAQIHAIGRRNTRLRAESVYQSYKEAFETAGRPLTEPILRECAGQALPYYENAAKTIGGFVRQQCRGIGEIDRMIESLDRDVEQDEQIFSNQIEIECTAARLKTKKRSDVYELFNQWWKSNPIIVIVVIVFGVLVALAAGVMTIQKAIALFFHSPVQQSAPVIQPAVPTAPLAAPTGQPTQSSQNAIPETPREPVLDLAIGMPFGSSTLITLKNSGVEELINIVVNLRCFLLTAPDDLHPDLLFQGLPSIDNANSWWVIKSLSPGKTVMKESVESMESFLVNGEKIEASAGRQSRGPVVSRQDVIALDVDYQRRSDRKRFAFSGLAELFKDGNAGKPFARPIPMSDFYRRLLDTIKPPTYRSGA